MNHTAPEGYTSVAPWVVTDDTARFVCKAEGCGYQANVDTNAARNFDHAAGHAVFRTAERSPLGGP